MTPEVEIALNKIGWQYVKFVSPWKAAFISGNLTLTGGRFTAHPIDAREELGPRFEQLMGAVSILCSEFETLPEEVRGHINHWSASSDELENEVPDRVSKARRALLDLVPGLLSAHEVITHESNGRSRREAAYRVADAVAEVYVIGTGKRPTFGINGHGEKGEPSTDFGRAVRDVFRALNINADLTRPCREARDKMTEDRLSELLGLRKPNRRKIPLWKYNSS